MSQSSTPYHWKKDKDTVAERRKRVRELNRAGKSNRDIVKELHINKLTVKRDLDFISQQEGIEIKSKYDRTYQREKWTKAINAIIDTLPYFTTRGIKPSVRTMFYRLSSEGYIKKTENDYQMLCVHTVQARLGKTDINGEILYPELPIDCFADETRRLMAHYEDDEPTEPGDPTEPEDPDEYIERVIKELKEAPGDYDPEGEEGEPGEVGGYWYDQPEYVEVWIEKFALAPTFESFLKNRHVNIAVNRGYSSLSFLWENCERLKEKIEKFGEENVHVLYFGDFDPSGEDMDRNYQDYFELFDIDPDIFERVALTEEQIQEYGIPLRPIKMKDSRANGWMLEHGNKAAELDAFLAVNADAFEEMVQKAVTDHWREDIYDQMVEDYEDVVNEPENKYEKDIAGMIQKITEAFKPGWDNEFYEDAQEGDNGGG